MASGKALLALASLAAVAVSTAGHAQTAGGSAAEITARERATNCSLLEALLKRRTEVAESGVDAADRKATLEFLDRRISQVRRRLGE